MPTASTESIPPPSSDGSRLRQIGFLPLLCIFYGYTAGGPVRLRRHLPRFRPGHGAGVPRVRSLLLEHSHFLRLRRTQQSSSRARRLLSLEPRGVRRLLGIPVWVVELDRHVSAQQSLRRAGDGLSQHLLSVADGLREMGRRVPGADRARVSECARHSGRRMAVGRAAGRRDDSGHVAVRGFTLPACITIQ